MSEKFSSGVVGIKKHSAGPYAAVRASKMDLFFIRIVDLGEANSLRLFII
jgi:hypothetical protein